MKFGARVVSGHKPATNVEDGNHLTLMPVPIHFKLSICNKSTVAVPV